MGSSAIAFSIEDNFQVKESLISFLCFYSGIIQSVVFVDKRTPSLNWYFRNETGPVSSMAFGYRILCARDYYGPNCTIYCNARDDSHGHYGCNSHGDKYCLTGWTNINNYCTTREYAF